MRKNVISRQPKLSLRLSNGRTYRAFILRVDSVAHETRTGTRVLDSDG